MDSKLLRQLERLSARVLDPQVARQLRFWPVPVSLGVPLPLHVFSFSSQLCPLAQLLGRRHVSLGLVSG